MTADKQETGAFGEEYVAEFLKRHGYEIVKRNYRVKGGEIDIIAKKGDMLAFVEVKTRRFGALTSGEQAITSSKKKYLIRTAKRFLSQQDEGLCGRFDVAAVVMDKDNKRVADLKYYVSAFDASE